MMTTNTKVETDNIKTKHSSIFGGAGVDKVGYKGTIIDGTYNKRWLIYTISGNTYQLFPMQNLTTHQMNPTDTNSGGYTASEMYTYIHNTVLPNLKKSGLNITACDLVSYDEYEDILSDTGIPRMDSRTDIPDNSDEFWTTSPWSYYGFYGVCSNGCVINSKKGASNYKGVRPLITVVM